VPPESGYERPQQPEIPSDTTEVIFVCCGDFVGFEDIIAKSLGRVGRLQFARKCLSLPICVLVWTSNGVFGVDGNSEVSGSARLATIMQNSEVEPFEVHLCGAVRPCCAVPSINN
jgi:hypothetical protein